MSFSELEEARSKRAAKDRAVTDKSKDSWRNGERMIRVTSVYGQSSPYRGRGFMRYCVKGMG
jgi:hypothetical protein